MTKFTTRLLFAVIILSLALSACGVARAALIGAWKDAESGMVLDFKQDGKLRYGSQGMTIEVDYQFVDDSSIILKGGEGQEDTQMVWKVEGDKLTLTPTDGTVAEFIRVK